MNNLLDKLYKIAPIVFILLFVWYLYNQYVINKLMQHVFSLQILDLEQKLGIEASETTIRKAMRKDPIISTLL